MILGTKNRAMLHRKCIQKSILYETGVKAEKYYKTNINLLKHEVSGIEKSNKHRAKIDEKMKARWG